MAGIVLAAPLLHREDDVWTSRWGRLEGSGLLSVFDDRTCEAVTSVLHVEDMVISTRDTDTCGVGREICLDLCQAPDDAVVAVLSSEHSELFGCVQKARACMWREVVTGGDVAHAVSKALAWLRHLHVFVARLQSELAELQGQEHTECTEQPRQAEAASTLLDAHAKLAGIEDVCRRTNCGLLPRGLGKSDTEEESPLLHMLLKSKSGGGCATRSSSGERSESIAAVNLKAPVQRLAPVARVPYMKHYYQKICL